jgi:RNA polymerase primary sigma factor
MHNELVDKAYKLLETSIRFFHHESFDDIKQRKDITADMPNFDIYQKGMAKVHRIKQGKINPEMLPCYESPLLDFPQEQHLFRKMNYFKYRAKQIISTINPEKPSENKMTNAEDYLRKAIEVRNQIAQANFRLATQIMKHRNSYSKELNQSDITLSDAYFDVLKAVDYFNWTLGHRFSTYATWVIKKNYFRDSKVKANHAERFCGLDEQKAELIEGRSSGFEDERAHTTRQQLIFKLIGMMVRENLGTDRVRQAYVLENYYGVNGRERKTLEQISEEINVTKERVRQLKEKGLEWIRDRVAEMNLEYDNDCPDESLF